MERLFVQYQIQARRNSIYLSITLAMGKNNGVVVVGFFYLRDCKHDIINKINPNKVLTWENCCWKAEIGVLWLFAERTL